MTDLNLPDIIEKTMLITEINIKFKAGDGGNGKVSFFKERRGPDGGNGGKGGSIYAVAT